MREEKDEQEKILKRVNERTEKDKRKKSKEAYYNNCYSHSCFQEPYLQRVFHISASYLKLSVLVKCIYPGSTSTLPLKSARPLYTEAAVVTKTILNPWIFVSTNADEAN